MWQDFICSSCTWQTQKILTQSHSKINYFTSVHTRITYRKMGFSSQKILRASSNTSEKCLTYVFKLPIKTPKRRLFNEYSSKSISIVGSKLFNSLPKEIKSSLTKPIFDRKSQILCYKRNMVKDVVQSNVTGMWTWTKKNNKWNDINVSAFISFPSYGNSLVVWLFWYVCHLFFFFFRKYVEVRLLLF